MCLFLTDVTVVISQLYDHRGEKLEDFTHLEIVNVAHRPAFQTHIVALRMKLVHFVKTVPLFRGCFRD